MQKRYYVGCVNSVARVCRGLGGRKLQNITSYLITVFKGKSLSNSQHFPCQLASIAKDKSRSRTRFAFLVSGCNDVKGSSDTIDSALPRCDNCCSSSWHLCSTCSNFLDKYAS
eukprot:m.112558 g.112558  ORF g.112558 m.112558 type:complete len:113 (-) comp13482_c1_seq1:428-766(-)